MNENPYAPPTAALGDGRLAPIVRPARVKLAVNIQWASLILSFVSAFWQSGALDDAAQWGGLALGILIGGALYSWFIFGVNGGRNWARIALLIFFLIGALPGFLELYKSFGTAPLLSALALLEWVMELYVLYLLFTEPASNWFREMKRRQ